MSISPYHGNLAVFALFLIIPFTFYMFAVKKPEHASVIVAIGVTLWWPVGVWVRVPLTPILDKGNLHFMAVLAAMVVFAGKELWRSKPGRGPEALMWLSLLASLATWKTNTDVQIFGTWIQRVLPGLDFKDGMAMGLDHVVRLMFPFIVGRALFTKSDHLLTLMKTYAVMGLVYTIPILLELRLSPRVHIWLYGYAASDDFLAVLRWGGYRPMVCMTNGLALSMMVLQMTMATVALTRADVQITKYFKNKVAAIGMTVILVLCKSTGAIMYGLVFLPMILKSKITRQLRVASVLGIVAISYPMMRSAELVPVDAILEAATMLSESRAGSLEFRFRNEEILGEKARERYWFGWGSYGRNSIYHHEIGKEMTIADGYWIILLGVRGFAGFILSFALALWPVFLASRVVPRLESERDQILLATLSLIVAVSIFDLIPNGLFSNYNYFFAGALYGLCKALDPGKGGAKKKRRRSRSTTNAPVSGP